MTPLRLGLGIAFIGACSFAWACSVASSAALGDNESAPTADRGASSSSGGAIGEGAPTSPGDLGPTDNAVILVHAAKAQPFRLCFSKARDLLPQPDSQSMPQANVVGVEVGNAVRVPSLPGIPGKVYLFEEPLIRSLYFNASDGKGPTCEDLLSSGTIGPLAIDLGDVDDNLATGVHLLVVKGCPKNTPGAQYSVAECGPTWTPATGNLAVDRITLAGAYRNDPKKLPTQVVNLSQPLDAARSGRPLSISFGDLSKSGKLSTVADNPKLFAAPSADPIGLDFDPDDLATYDASGFRVQVPANGSLTAIDVDYTLAQIQKLSAPRDVPSSYYSVASNYVLLLLGDPNAKLEDASPDTDPRRALHFLAVPVVEHSDAGAPDASPDSP